MWQYGQGFHLEGISKTLVRYYSDEKNGTWDALGALA